MGSLLAKEKKRLGRIEKSAQSLGGEFVVLFKPPGRNEVHAFASPAGAEFEGIPACTLPMLATPSRLWCTSQT